MEPSSTVVADPAPALSRGLALLRGLGADGPQTLEQMARVSGWPKSSLLRLLRSLTAFGAVRRDPVTKRYHALLGLTPLTARVPGLVERAGSSLDQLCECTGQTAELYALDGDDLTMIDRREPDDAVVSVRARIGFRRNLTELEALTQVTLAFAHPTVQPHRLATHASSYWAWRQGKRARVPAARARAVVEQTARRRVGVDLGVNEFGVRRYAAPITVAGRLVGIIAIAQFCVPGNTQPDPALRQAVHDAGQTLSTSNDHKLF